MHMHGDPFALQLLAHGTSIVQALNRHLMAGGGLHSTQCRHDGFRAADLHTVDDVGNHHTSAYAPMPTVMRLLPERRCGISATLSTSHRVAEPKTFPISCRNSASLRSDSGRSRTAAITTWSSDRCSTRY